MQLEAFNNIELQFLATQGGKYLDTKNRDFELALFDDIERYLGEGGYQDSFKELFEEYFKVKKDVQEKHFITQEIIVILFEHISIHTGFGMQLRRYDTIAAECLVAKSKIGESLISFLSSAEYYFILTSRTWRSPVDLTLTFEAFYGDNSQDICHTINNGTYDCRH